MHGHRPQQTAYLAAEGFEEQLAQELGALVTGQFGQLFLTDTAPVYSIWAQNIWYDPQWIEIESISDAARKLRTIQRNWWPYAHDFFRRSNLIQEKLPHISAKPLDFPGDIPTAPLGSWCLIDKSTLLAAPACASPFPNGEIHFNENKTIPPTRAYLKLWETFTRTGHMPGTGDTCIDLGACPGGWSWVLHELGAKVISVDKAPLAPHIGKLPNITFRKDSAFALEPQSIGRVDWLFSDVICYPKRLLTLVNKWISSGLAGNMVCTIKLQGDTDHDTVSAFKAIPGSTIMHLFHNKHELTWIWQKQKEERYGDKIQR